MRIDDDNKVIWCNKEEIEWYETYDSWENDKRKIIVHHLARMGFGYALTNRNGSEAEGFWHKLDSIKLELIKAVIDNYTFKLEQSKKYYWRKKKEYLAEFEEYGDSYGVSRVYLNSQKNRKELSLESRNETPSFKTMFTESEVRELLNQDFDKFEKVEIDE